MTVWNALTSVVRPCALVALALAACVVTAAPALAANSGFVSASGGQFVLNGRPFYFVGSNAYYLIPAATWGSTNYTDETMTMAPSLGFTVFRTWGFLDDPSQATALQTGPGVYNEASFRKMDYVLNKADQAGVRLIISLVNHWAEFGGMPQYVSWCSPGSSTDVFYSNTSCRQLYKNYVSHLINRVNTYNGRTYRNDPTVFAWELANEPRSGDRSGQLVRGWIAEMAAYVKSIDPNHMVTTGEEGFDITSTGYNLGAYNNQTWLFDGTDGVAFTQNIADPNIAFAQVHLYPEYWNLPSSSGNAWIADHVRIARLLGKPLLVGEFGYAADSATVYDQWLGTFDTANGGGALVWQLMCTSCYAMRDQFGVQYPPSSAVSEALRRAAAIANAKNSTPPDKVPPGPPTGITVGGVSVSPGTVGPGQSVTMTVPMTSATAASSVLIDLEVYDGAGKKVAQNAISGQTFNAGQTRTYTWAWPGSATAGAFEIKVGAFSNDWSQLYVWKDGAATITVASSAGSGGGSTFAVTSAGTSPSSVTRGGTVNISTSIRSRQTTSAIVDLELYDTVGTKVGQNVCNVSFNSGQTKSCRWSYVVPSSFTSGLYTLKVGVFSPNWSVLYVWVDQAGVLTVQ